MTDLIIDLPDDLKSLALEKAKLLGKSLDEVIKDFLAEFVIKDIKKLSKNINIEAFLELGDNDETFKSQEGNVNHKPIRKVGGRDHKFSF